MTERAREDDACDPAFPLFALFPELREETASHLTRGMCALLTMTCKGLLSEFSKKPRVASQDLLREARSYDQLCALEAWFGLVYTGVLLDLVDAGAGPEEGRRDFLEHLREARPHLFVFHRRSTPAFERAGRRAHPAFIEDMAVAGRVAWDAFDNDTTQCVAVLRAGAVRAGNVNLLNAMGRAGAWMPTGDRPMSFMGKLVAAIRAKNESALQHLLEEGPPPASAQPLRWPAICFTALIGEDTDDQHLELLSRYIMPHVRSGPVDQGQHMAMPDTPSIGHVMNARAIEFALEGGLLVPGPRRGYDYDALEDFDTLTRMHARGVIMTATAMLHRALGSGRPDTVDWVVDHYTGPQLSDVGLCDSFTRDQEALPSHAVFARVLSRGVVRASVMYARARPPSLVFSSSVQH